MIPLGHPVTWDQTHWAPFHDWHSMVRFLRLLQRQNDDAVILLDGREGSGKSTLAWQLCRALSNKWDPENHLVIDYEDWLELYELNPGQVFLLDEGGDLMFSRNSMSHQNKHLVRIFQMSRIFNHIVVANAPNIRWVDVYTREHRAIIYGHVHKEYTTQGVKRGRVTFHWANRWYNHKTNEWGNTWRHAWEGHFKPVPETNREWIAYEQLKRAKIHNRQRELTR